MLIQFMVWFILNFVPFYQNAYKEVVLFFTQQPSSTFFSVFIVTLNSYYKWFFWECAW